MQIKPITSKEYFKGIRIVHFALVAGQVFFALITLFLLQVGKLDMEGQGLINVFIFILPLFVVAGIIASQVMFKIKLKEVKKKINLSEKLIDYRSALIVRYALLEGPSFFAIVVYMFTGELMFLGMAVLIILIFLFISPSVEKAGNDLELGQKEKQMLADPNSVVDEIKTK